jgi:hypothetical protein
LDWSMSASAMMCSLTNSEGLVRAGDRQNVYLQSSTNAETFCLSPAFPAFCPDHQNENGKRLAAYGELAPINVQFALSERSGSDEITTKKRAFRSA